MNTQFMPLASHVPETIHVRPKSPRLAAFLSFLCPGLGQLYCGQIAKGFLLVLLTLVCTVLALAVIGLILLSSLSAWSIYDAYTTAAAINREIALAEPPG